MSDEGGMCGAACVVKGGVHGKRGMHGRGCEWLGGGGGCVAGGTATAADGMHPTRMFSCVN